MTVTDDDRIAAEARLESETRGRPRAVRARYDRRVARIVVGLDSGLELMFAPRLAQGLEHASAADLSNIEISPLGDGLHWPTLDADLYVPALLDGIFGTPRWMAARAGEQAQPEGDPGRHARRSRKAAAG